MSLSRDIPACTLYLQGGMVVVTGIYALIKPADAVKFFPLDGQPDAVLLSMSSLTLVGLGTYQILAGRTPALHRTVLLANVGLRLLAAGVFSQHGRKVRVVVINEVVFAVLNAVALYCCPRLI